MADREVEFTVGSLFVEARKGTMEVECEVVERAVATW